MDHFFQGGLKLVEKRFQLLTRPRVQMPTESNSGSGCGCRKAWKGWGENGKEEREKGEENGKRKKRKTERGGRPTQPLLADTH